jgi:hypothetical protein
MALPVGSAIDPQGVRGYHLDMRVKISEPDLLPPDMPARDRVLWIVLVQYGMGAWERFVLGEGEQWLAVARRVADELLDAQADDGAWHHGYQYPHTYDLAPGWISAITQGEAASLLVRLHRETGEQRYADAARAALVPMTIPTEQGGCQATLDGHPFAEEYPTRPGSYVLNGSIFALWGFRDVAIGLGDPDAQREWDTRREALKATLHRWDLGYWSRYDLYPHPLVNISSSFYHDLHVVQLRATGLLTGDPWFTEVAERWSGYEAHRRNTARALARKVAFRLAVPRNRVLARRLPWSR